jgi:hypothetical protein
MKNLSSTIVCVLLVASCLTAGYAQADITPAPAVSSVLPHLTVSADLLAGLPRRTVAVTEENGESATYSGVDLGALLAKNGAPQGPALRGPAAADYVLIQAADGYRAVFALTELDAAITDKIVVLADQRNGAPSGPRLGPFRIVVPDEKHHLRWVRNVVEIAVLSAP